MTLAAAHANLFAPMVAAGRSIPGSTLFRQSASMFRRRPDAGSATISVIVEGRTILVPAGAWAAAAVLAAGLRSIRETPVEGRERAPYCMMGICFDCLAEIDCVPNRRSRIVEARRGMRIRRQIRAREIER
ncbi:MAG TPA: 2Fe-2S iron-sulfur cluster-binding protein [Stellaceae bacterium]|nr:2Fe-2S iron-sulfur cluster-binding protein [Stellaceae bacterium]